MLKNFVLFKAKTLRRVVENPIDLIHKATVSILVTFMTKQEVASMTQELKIELCLLVTKSRERYLKVHVLPRLRRQIIHIKILLKTLHKAFSRQLKPRRSKKVRKGLKMVLSIFKNVLTALQPAISCLIMLPGKKTNNNAGLVVNLKKVVFLKRN